MAELIMWIVAWVKSMGYPGIFIMTLIESTFVPVPAELTMIPAGYLVQQGHMNGYAVMSLAIAGTVCGSLINYIIAYFFGRMLVLRYGKYFFMPEHKLLKMEEYFVKYGSHSTFIGRLLPGVRHYISFPAGLARMNIKLFTFYTMLGGTIWLSIIFAMGYYIGENEELAKRSIIYLKGAILLGMIIAGIWYLRKCRKNKLMRELLETPDNMTGTNQS